MKFKRILFLFLVLALMLSGCQGKDAFETRIEGHTLTVDTLKATVTDGKDIYYYEYESPNIMKSTTVIHYPDGVTYTKEFQGTIEIVGGNGSSGSSSNTPKAEGKYTGTWDESRYLPGDILATAVQRAVSMEENQKEEWDEAIRCIVCAVLCLIVGALNVFFPDVLWHLKHWWSVEGGEPSEMYLSYSRFFGVVFMVIGVIFLLVGIF